MFAGIISLFWRIGERRQTNFLSFMSSMPLTPFDCGKNVELCPMRGKTRQ